MSFLIFFKKNPIVIFFAQSRMLVSLFKKLVVGTPSRTGFVFENQYCCTKYVLHNCFWWKFFVISIYLVLRGGGLLYVCDGQGCDFARRFSSCIGQHCSLLPDGLQAVRRPGQVRGRRRQVLRLLRGVLLVHVRPRHHRQPPQRDDAGAGAQVRRAERIIRMVLAEFFARKNK